MNTLENFTENQQKALELVKRLSDENRITLSEAILFIIAIYESKKEFVYIPYQNPYPYAPYTPWVTTPEIDKSPYTDDTPQWNRYKITCNENNSVSVDPNKHMQEAYTTNTTKWDPLEWITNTLIG